jgi:hypothetical protein
MNSMSRKLAIFCAILAASAAIHADSQSKKKTAAPSTSYYFGPVVYVSPDGKTVMGKVASLVTRTVNPASATITETVMQASRASNGKTREYKATLTRKDANHFSITDAEHSYTGTITFSGPEWNWTDWTYDLQLVEGGRITGKGSLTKDGLLIEKTLLEKDGSTRLIVRENLKPVTQALYLDLRKNLQSR